jgi:hypothetical protein
MSDTTVRRASGPKVAEEVEMQHDKSDPGVSGATPPTSPMPSRRRLLKAASSMPLVATLPSGAALANASSLQCVINEQNDPQQAPGTQLTATPNPDSYIRVDGRIQKWLIGGPDVASGGPGTAGQVIDIYVYTINGQQITIVGDNPQSTSVAPAGTWFYPNAKLAGQNFAHQYIPRSDTDEQTQFLYVYQSAGLPTVGVSVDPATKLPTACDIPAQPTWPGSNPTNVCDDANGNPIACPPTPDGPQAPAHCVWPLARPVTSATQGGNIPLTHSCLASFGT